MKNKKSILLMWIIAVLPLLLVAAVYGRLPDAIPTQFGFDGTVNSYGPKSTLWLLAGICPLFAALFQFLPLIDPRRANYGKFQKYYDLFAIGLELFLTAILGLVLTESLHPGTLSMGRAILALLAVLFILIGNMMGKVKSNYFFGIKTPWALDDPDIWARTNRLGGRLWFITGVLLLPCSLLLPETVSFVLMLVGILGSSVLVYVLSYVWYRQKHQTDESKKPVE